MFVRKFIAFVIGFVGCFSASAEAMSFAEFAYQRARGGRVADVQKYLNRGYPIDAVDEQGVTALCKAMKHRDFKAYKILVKLGANPKQKCILKRSQKQTPAVATDDGNMSLYAGAGILAAGATAAVLLSDSGGSSSIRIDSPVKCAPDEVLVNGECRKQECAEGTHLENGECVPDTQECAEGTHLENGECVPDTQECPVGTHLENGECVPDAQECPVGERWNGKSCEAIICPENTHLEGNNCVVDDNLHIQNENDEDVYGVKSSGENVYNLLSLYRKPKEEETIRIDNVGDGDVYGLYGLSNVANAQVAGEDNYGNINPISTGYGSIIISDNGSGSVYGLYSKIADVTQYKEALNALGYKNGTAYGNIEIVHTGGGASYGLLGDVRAYNALSETGGNAYGNITVHGDGDIYGLSGYAAAFNAVAYQFAPGEFARGNINLYSEGDGDIYGMKVSKEDIPDVGGSETSWFGLNAFANGDSHVEGNIFIHNTGDGNVYGMYGGVLLFNALSYGTAEDGAKGTIKVVNLGQGDVYGMYMPGSDDNGELANLHQDNAHGVIDLINTGDGVTTGLRGGRNVDILNSGDISINNAGNGTAVGIYAEEGSKVHNSGVIHIYRESFTDETDNNKVYTPAGAKGGTAYGIYAERGVAVDNTGEIVITGAEQGAGIYLEAGATLENGGVVRFNGADDSVVENGEMLDIYGSGTREAAPATVDFNEMGQGEIILAKGGQFFAKSLSGTMGVSEKSVLGSFDDTYVLDGALQAENVDDLSLEAKSALFKAQTRQRADEGYDVVLERQNFAQVLKDKSFAQFLEQNYQLQNNGELYDELKQTQSLNELNVKSARFSGADVLPHLERENALVYRRLSRQFNDELFNKPTENLVGGYKYLDISASADGQIVGSDASAHAAYGLMKKKADNGVIYGLGASIAQIKSDYDSGSDNKNNQFGLWLPIGYQFDNGVKWFSKLYAGYSDGTYHRLTPSGKKNADYDAYQYGISQEARYALSLGGGYHFEPVAELNFLGQRQQAFDEGNSLGAIAVDSHNRLSLEGGLGAYLTRDIVFDENSKLGLRIGGIYYLEFLDTDDKLRASMAGMSGKYDISTRKDRGRAALSARVSYQYKDMTLYGEVEKETGDDKALVIDAGVQYKF